MEKFRINYKTVNEIEDMIYKSLEYFDEYTYSQALFIVEFALGMKQNYQPESYVCDIINHFGITPGIIQNEEMVEYLINKHLEHVLHQPSVLPIFLLLPPLLQLIKCLKYFSYLVNIFIIWSSLSGLSKLKYSILSDK